MDWELPILLCRRYAYGPRPVGVVDLRTHCLENCFRVMKIEFLNSDYDNAAVFLHYYVA